MFSSLVGILKSYYNSSLYTDIICVHNALVICNHSPQPPHLEGGRGTAMEMSGALTKVLPWQCGGNTWGFVLCRKGREMKRWGVGGQQRFLSTSSAHRVGL